MSSDQKRSTARIVLLICLLVGVVALDSFSAPTVYPTGVTIHDPARAYQGFNLFIDPSRNLPNGLIVLTDMAGGQVQTWNSPVVGMEKAHLVEPLSSGNILAAFGEDGGYGTLLVELDWNGFPVWQFAPPKGVHIHHDFERLANGNTSILVSRSEFFPEIGPNPIQDDLILEVDPQGQTVWAWSTAAHYASIPLTRKEREEIWRRNQGGTTTVFHTNSLAVLPPNPLGSVDPRFAPGNLILSQRDTNIVLIIDRASGDVVWSTKVTIGQHQVHMLDPSLPGAGDILMLDNGGASSYANANRLFSQVLELDPSSGATVWQYDATDSQLRLQAFFGSFKGGAQRLPNGNTLITEAPWGRAFEVTTQGDIVWEFVLPNSVIYRLMRVGPNWPASVAPRSPF